MDSSILDRLIQNIRSFRWLPKTSLHKKLTSFLDEEKYCDVKIRVQDEIFNCHRLILASASNYFDAMFGGRFVETSSEEIILHEIDAITFKVIIKSIYSGCEPSINFDNFRSLLTTGQFLGMSNIVEKCERFILDNLKELSINMFELLDLACCTSSHLKKELSNYILHRFQTFVKHDDFPQISYDNLNLLLKEYRTSIVPFKSESFLLDAIIRWAYHSCEEREKYLQELVGMVDFSKVSAVCESFIINEYHIYFEAAEESADSRIVKHIKPRDQDQIVINDRIFHIIPFEDSQYSESLSTIHLIFDDMDEKQNVCRYNIISLSNNKVEPDWFESCKFSKRCRIDAFTALSDCVYCFDAKQSFVAYSSVDFSSEPLRVLASIPLRDILIRQAPKMCGFNNSHIYLLKKPNILDSINRTSPPKGFNCEEFERGFYCYKCDVDKWFPVSSRNKELDGSCLIADDALVYLIGGTSFQNEDNSKRYVQAYDPRSPAWITLPNSTHEHSNNEMAKSSSCAINDKIYICNNNHIECFDRIAGRWETIWDTKRAESSFYGSTPITSYENKLYIFERNASNEDTEFCIYDPTSRIWSSVTRMNIGPIYHAEILVFKTPKS